MSAEPAELLNSLTEAGISVWSNGEKLFYRPRSRVPSETVEKLREAKPELLRLLRVGCNDCRAEMARGVQVLLCSCGFSQPIPRHFSHECSGWNRERVWRERERYTPAEREVWNEEWRSILEAHSDLDEVEAGRRAAALVERGRRSGYFKR